MLRLHRTVTETLWMKWKLRRLLADQEGKAESYYWALWTLAECPYITTTTTPASSTRRSIWGKRAHPTTTTTTTKNAKAYNKNKLYSKRNHVLRIKAANKLQQWCCLTSFGKMVLFVWVLCGNCVDLCCALYGPRPNESNYWNSTRLIYYCVQSITV